MGIITIKDINKTFKKEADCIGYLEWVFWDNKPICPYCQNKKASAMPKEHRYHCNNCHSSFSVTVGTIFHRSRLDLRKWFLAIYYLINEPTLSLRELADRIEVTKDTVALLKRKIEIVPTEKLETIISFI